MWTALILTFLPTNLSLYCTPYSSSTSSPAPSTRPPCFLWPATEGLEVSPHHRRVLFPLEAAVGCLLIGSEILNLDLAASYKHRWPHAALPTALSICETHTACHNARNRPQRCAGLCQFEPFPYFGCIVPWKQTKVSRSTNVLRFHWAAAEMDLIFRSLNGQSFCRTR